MLPSVLAVLPFDLDIIRKYLFSWVAKYFTKLMTGDYF